MPLKFSYKFNSNVNIKQKIECLKTRLELEQTEIDKGGFTLRDKQNTIRIDISSSQDKDFNLFYSLSIILNEDKNKDIIFDCLGKPEYQRIKKPSIMDICQIIIANKEKKEGLFNYIQNQFNLSEDEVKNYLGKILGFLKIRKAPPIVTEAANIIKELD
jgi:hypothetical protein